MSTPPPAEPPRLEDFPARAADTVRYGDTDRQGHVNNAAFATFLETGRCQLLYDPALPLAPAGTAFVLVRLVLDLRQELHWPGTVEIGTRLARLGRSSFTLSQALFQAGRCAATSESVVVLMDESTRRATPLPETSRTTLRALAG